MIRLNYHHRPRPYFCLLVRHPIMLITMKQLAYLGFSTRVGDQCFLTLQDSDALILMREGYTQIRHLECRFKRMRMDLMFGTPFIKVGQSTYEKQGSMYCPCIPFFSWWIQEIPRTMDLSFRFLRGRARGHNKSSESWIYRKRLSVNPSLELKVNWCFEMFHLLDNSLTTYMLSS